MGLFNIIFLSIGITCIVMGGICLIKNEVTYRNHELIINAIGLYQYHMINTGNGDKINVSFDDIESYGDTFWRLFDWGYKHVLPPDKLKTIEPYIDAVKKAK